MRRLVVLAALMTLGASGGALAQEAAAQDAPTAPASGAAEAGPQGVIVRGVSVQGATAEVGAKRPGYSGPGFLLFGIPVRMGAPVSPAYAPNAYETFAGQPMTGLDQVMSQEAGGEPREGVVAP